MKTVAFKCSDKFYQVLKRIQEETHMSMSDCIRSMIKAGRAPMMKEMKIDCNTEDDRKILLDKLTTMKEEIDNITRLLTKKPL